MATTRALAPLSLALCLALSSVAHAAPSQPGFLTRTAQKIATRLEARRAYRSAARDFGAWLKEPGNEQLATFYKGARGETGVGALRLARGAALVTGAAYAAIGAAHGDAIASGIGVGAMGTSQLNNGTIKTLEQQARERTIDLGLSKVSAERLARWSRAGIIDPGLAR